MGWPEIREYAEAVRDYPDISIQDPKLKGGKPKIDKFGLLISYSGGFSIVFPIVRSSNTFALRCWTQDVENAEVRYKEVDVYLKRVRLPYFVDCEYVPKGILVSGTSHPITRMEWADGLSLRDFISQNLQHPHLFKVVADEFQKMIATLHKHQIAHGDLQDGNILLKQNGRNVEIKLIDYDTLFVPALSGQLDEIRGLPEYQHPKRMTAGETAQVNEKVDYFSELVIYLSFLALSEKPELWNEFEDETEKGLLFSEKDFENPDRSPIFSELAHLSSNVQKLAWTLKDFCAKTSIDQLEPLEAILPTLDTKTKNPALKVWKAAAITLGAAFVICFIVLLTQINQGAGPSPDKTKLENQLSQKESEIQALTLVVQTLENDKKKLSRENGRLQGELEDLRDPPPTIPRDVENQLQQLSDQNQHLQDSLVTKDNEIRQLRNEKVTVINENRKLKNQIDESNPGIADQNAVIQQLRSENLKVRTEKQTLQKQLTAKTSEVKKLTARTQQLQNEKTEVQRQNQKLKSENEDLTRQNRSLRNNNENLQDQMPKDDQEIFNPKVSPELPKRIQDYRNVGPRAASHNNQGVIAFDEKDYNKAIGQFKTAIKANARFEEAYYNLGCTFLETKDYPKAITAFSDAVGINPKFKEAHYNLGLAYLRKGAYREAKNSVEQALGIDENYKDAQKLLTTIENVRR